MLLNTGHCVCVWGCWEMTLYFQLYISDCHLLRGSFPVSLTGLLCRCSEMYTREWQLWSTLGVCKPGGAKQALAFYLNRQDAGQTWAHLTSFFSLCPWMCRAHIGHCMKYCYIDILLHIINIKHTHFIYMHYMHIIHMHYHDTLVDRAEKMDHTAWLYSLLHYASL